MKIVDDKDLDDFIKNELNKDITQEDSVDPSVEEHMKEMGWLFAASREKLEKDKTCFKCKKEVDMKKEKLHMLEATKTEKGVFAITTVCEKCFKEMEKKSKEVKNGRRRKEKKSKV